MAKRGYDIPVPSFGRDWQGEFNWISDLIEKGVKNYIDNDDLKGYIWTHQVADGYAYYMVTSLRPLTLCHVPAIDAWHVPDAHLRGLRVDDIRQHAEWHKRWNELTRLQPIPLQGD